MGIIFVLKSGIPWEMLRYGHDPLATLARLDPPRSVGSAPHELRNRLRDTDQTDWSRAAMNTSLVLAKKGGVRPGRTRRIAVIPGRSGTW